MKIMKLRWVIRKRIKTLSTKFLNDLIIIIVNFKNMTKAKTSITLSLIALTLVFALELLYRSPLQAQSLTMIPEMQINERPKSLMSRVSLLSEFVVVPLSLLLSFNLINRISALYVWMSVGFVIFFNLLLKSLY